MLLRECAPRLVGQRRIHLIRIQTGALRDAMESARAAGVDSFSKDTAQKRFQKILSAAELNRMMQHREASLGGTSDRIGDVPERQAEPRGLPFGIRQNVKPFGCRYG
jgi:hypothetical protein